MTEDGVLSPTENSTPKYSFQCPIYFSFRTDNYISIDVIYNGASPLQVRTVYKIWYCLF